MRENLLSYGMRESTVENIVIDTQKDLQEIADKAREVAMSNFNLGKSRNCTSQG